MPETSQQQHQQPQPDSPGCIGCLGAPFFIVAGLVYFLPAQAISRRRTTRKLLDEMIRAGRVLSWDELDATIQSKGGTLLVDWPYWGWSGLHVWWTPDDIQARPDAPPWGTLEPQPPTGAAMNELARFSQWTAAQYFGPNAQSFLIHTSFSNRQSELAEQRVAQLRIRHPNLKYSKISSTMHDWYAKEDEADQPGP